MHSANTARLSGATIVVFLVPVLVLALAPLGACPQTPKPGPRPRTE